MFMLLSGISFTMCFGTLVAVDVTAAEDNGTKMGDWER